MSQEAAREDRFPYPEELELPSGLEGWEEMYPSYYRFGRTDERQAYERSLWWIQDLATTDPIRPWDATVSVDAWQTGWAQNTSRVLPIPTAMSIEIRLIAGYAYTAGTVVEDEGLIEERTELFEERFEYWVENFEELYEETWKPAIRDLAEEVQALDVPDDLPRYADDEVVREARGQVPIVDVIEAYDRLVELALEGWQRHFEFLTFSYLVVADFREFCTEAFPKIPETNVTKMVSAADADVYRPDRELNRLAELAVELGDEVTAVLVADAPPAATFDRLEETAAGREFLAAFEDAEDPWFHMSNGDGFHSNHGTWIDDYETPLASLATKVARLQDGESLGRDVDARRQESRELFEEYRRYLTDEAERAEFETLYERCRDIYYYAEDHNFWIDHRLNTLVFAKMREFGALLESSGLLDDADDVFLFTRYEVAELLEELLHTWALGPTGFVPERWNQLAGRRAEIMAAARDWDPAPALGDPPETIEDPVLEMLNGVTQETVEEWLDREGDGESAKRSHLDGLAASEGTVEGPARVVRSVDGLDRLQEGDVLVCPLMGPSWAPAFSRVAGVVTDKGGVSSHAAVVCREYGLPAVVCTEHGTTDIDDGDRLRIDGSTGTVEVLSRAE